MFKKLAGVFTGKNKKTVIKNNEENNQQEEVKVIKEKPSKQKNKKTEAPVLTANFELVGKNDAGYVFVSKTGETGVALFEPDGSIHFVGCDPEKIDELDENERNIFTAKSFFIERSLEDMQHIVLAQAQEPGQEVQQSESLLEDSQEISLEVKGILTQESSLQESVSSDIDKVEIIKTEETEEPLKRISIKDGNMDYQGIDDTIIAQLSGRGISNSRGLAAIEIVSRLVKEIEFTDVETKMETLYCDILVSNLAINLYMLNKPEEYSRFVDVFLEGKRTVSGNDCLRLASFSRAMPVLNEFLPIIKNNEQVSAAKINRNFLDKCKEALLTYEPEGIIAQRPAGCFDSFNLVMDKEIASFVEIVSAFPDQSIQAQNF